MSTFKQVQLSEKLITLLKDNLPGDFKVIELKGTEAAVDLGDTLVRLPNELVGYETIQVNETGMVTDAKKKVEAVASNVAKGCMNTSDGVER